jgi:3-oxoacyl-[acyl-carrier-protein] synthase II
MAMLHTDDPVPVAERLRWFLDKHLAESEEIDLLLSGENGDRRLLPFYRACESLLPPEVPIARFKHMCGEYPTASAFALWLASRWPAGRALPIHMIKREAPPSPGSGTAAYDTKMDKTVLVYNTYKGVQHSFMLLSRMDALFDPLIHAREFRRI